MKNRFYIFIGVLILINLISCVQSYTPPAIQVNNNFLVVDGFLNSGSDTTSIKLSRSQILSATSTFVPELHAQISVLAGNSSAMPFVEQGNGIYACTGLNLSYNQQYQMKIITSDGKEYLSDSIVPKLTPPIDSVYLRQENDYSGVNIYLDTHNPQNNTRYYLWNFTQTWEHISNFTSSLQFDSAGQLVLRSPEKQIHTCWTVNNSTDILTSTTANIEQDIVNRQPILLIPPNSQQISILYSVLVRQYAITQEAFEYWQNLKTSTEQLGTIFGPQPSQVSGNIHCVSNPSEPVLGYLSACSQSEQRIFINRNQLYHWQYIPPTCFLTTLAQYQIAQAFADSELLIPVSEAGAGMWFFAPASCADCRYDDGGVTTKPPFWP